MSFDMNLLDKLQGETHSTDEEEPEEEPVSEDDAKKTKTTKFAAGEGETSSFWKSPEFPEKYPLDHINVENLVNMLSKIRLVWPEDLPYFDELELSVDSDRTKFPPSYYKNTDKEKVVLWHAENFRRQFINKFPNRRPPVIAPRNECGCQKLFPTYINPTASGYPEFMDCVTTVAFLKDFFTPGILSPPTKFPERIRSHTTAIKRRKTNAFEMAVIIVSLLRGSGYDAYVVDGFASKTICVIDTTEEYTQPEEKPILDYVVDREKELQDEKELGGFGFAIDYSYLLEKVEETTLVPVSPSKYRFKEKEIDVEPVDSLEVTEDPVEAGPHSTSQKNSLTKQNLPSANAGEGTIAAIDEEEEGEEEEEEGSSEEEVKGDASLEEIVEIADEEGNVEEGFEKENEREELEEELAAVVRQYGGEYDGEGRYQNEIEGEWRYDELGGEGMYYEQLKGNEQEEEEEEEMEEEIFDELSASVKDRYHGKRTHAWILVLPGARDVDEAFFLEPFSGTWRPLKDPNFLSVEAVFNEKNYWINIQPHVRNLKLMNWNLNNPSAWSKFLVESHQKKKRRKKQESGGGDAGGGGAFQDDDEDDAKPKDMFLTMPVSWTTDLEISQDDYDRKYPDGIKTIEFSDAVMEVAAPYANPDGRVRKVLKFTGHSREPEDLEYIEEWFQHRKDKLTRRKWYRDGKMLHEYFAKGRKDALKEHVHVSGRNRADFPRDLYYYANAHPRSISHRKIIRKGMIEYFEGRDDLLYYKTTLYGGILCNTIPVKEDKNRGKARDIMEMVKGIGGGGANRKIARRKIIKISEKYHRNEEHEAKDDIAEKHMLIDECRLRIFFHYQKGNLTRNTLEFYKMAKPGQSKYAPIEFKPEDCIEYYANPKEPPIDVYKKFTLLQHMDRYERSSSVLSREAEDEVYNTVTARVQEDWRNEIEPDAFAGDRNEEYLKMKDQQASDEEVGEADLSGTDFTTPFFEKYGAPKNKREEILMKKRIMLHEKVKIMRRAFMIKELYDKEAGTLREKQDWYSIHESQMNPTQEEGFTHMYKERLFQLHILEQRMVRHQQETPRLYYNLLVQLLRHPQLNRFTNKKIPPPPLPEKALTEEEKARIAKELAKLKDCCQFFNIRFSEKKGKKKHQEEEVVPETNQEEERRKSRCRRIKKGSNARRSSVGGRETSEPTTREDNTTATTIQGEAEVVNI